MFVIVFPFFVCSISLVHLCSFILNFICLLFYYLSIFVLVSISLLATHFFVLTLLDHFTQRVRSLPPNKMLGVPQELPLTHDFNRCMLSQHGSR